MSRRARTRFSELVQHHSPYPSLAELGRAIDEPNLAYKLNRYKRQRRLPTADVLDRIAAELDSTGQALLINALAWDARLPGYTDEESARSRAYLDSLRAMTPDQRSMVLILLRSFSGDPVAHDQATQVVIEDTILSAGLQLEAETTKRPPGKSAGRPPSTQRGGQAAFNASRTRTRRRPSSPA